MIDFSLYLISDRTVCKHLPLTEALVLACRSGVRGIQLREKDMTAGELFILAQDVCAALASYPVTIMINDRTDIACAVQAGGVHLPEAGLPPDVAKMCLEERALVGVSTHSLESACRAEAQGADFITFGPVFHTPSKAQYGAPLGLDALERVVRTVKLPVFAIGGITPDRASLCLENGAHGVAVISAILASGNIPGTVQAFESTMKKL